MMDYDVVVLADGSHSVQHQRAGWAAWIERSGGKPIIVHQAVDIVVDSSLEAEMLAIAGGLRNAAAHYLIRDGDRVLIESDNTGVIGWILGRVPTAQQDALPGGIHVNPPRGRHHRARISRGLHQVATLVDAYKLTLIVRHRPRVSDDRSKAIDRKAKEMLTAAIARVSV